MNSAAQHQRGQDAEEQHLVLVDGRHRERRHDDHEDEQVVDAEAVLGDVAGEELPRVPPAGEDQDPDPEQHREDDVEHHPPGRLAEPDGVRVVVDDEQVDRQQHQDAREGCQPQPGGYVHDPPPDGQRWSTSGGLSRRLRGRRHRAPRRSDGTVVTMPPRRDTPLHDCRPVSPTGPAGNTRARPRPGSSVPRVATTARRSHVPTRALRDPRRRSGAGPPVLRDRSWAGRSSSGASSPTGSSPPARTEQPGINGGLLPRRRPGPGAAAPR